jgi:nickel transport protein
MLSKLIKNSVLMLVFLFIASFYDRPAFGHYLWIAQQGENYIVGRGIIPDKFYPYNPDAVTFIKVFDAEGKDIPVNRVNDKERVIFRTGGSISLAAVRCDWGDRVNTTRGKKLMNRRDAEQQGFKVLESFLSTQTSKTLFEDGAAVCKYLGMKFELVPIKSPFKLEPGELLELKLMYDGAPLRNAAVSSDVNTRTKTDENGMVRIDVSKTGWNVIMAKHIVPSLNDVNVDYHQFMTFLVVKVK